MITNSWKGHTFADHRWWVCEEEIKCVFQSCWEVHHLHETQFLEGREEGGVDGIAVSVSLNRFRCPVDIRVVQVASQPDDGRSVGSDNVSDLTAALVRSLSLRLRGFVSCPHLHGEDFGIGIDVDFGISEVMRYSKKDSSPAISAVSPQSVEAWGHYLAVEDGRLQPGLIGDDDIRSARFNSLPEDFLLRGETLNICSEDFDWARARIANIWSYRR